MSSHRLAHLGLWKCDICLQVRDSEEEFARHQCIDPANLIVSPASAAFGLSDPEDKRSRARVIRDWAHSQLTDQTRTRAEGTESEEEFARWIDQWCSTAVAQHPELSTNSDRFVVNSVGTTAKNRFKMFRDRAVRSRRVKLPTHEGSEVRAIDLIYSVLEAGSHGASISAGQQLIKLRRDYDRVLRRMTEIMIAPDATDVDRSRAAGICCQLDPESNKSIDSSDTLTDEELCEIERRASIPDAKGQDE